jgi:hypothetical protein
MSKGVPWLEGFSAEEQQWAKHEATRTQADGVDIVIWQRPNDSHYAVRYCLLSDGPTGETALVVTGDLGEAVYIWYGAIHLEAIADCGLSYFSEKCQASETGRRYLTWDPERARQALCEALDDAEQKFGADLRGASESGRGYLTSRELCAAAEAMRNGNNCDSQGDFVLALYEDDAWILLLGEDASELTDCGLRPHVCCELHLRGLKAALGYLSYHEEGKADGVT